MLLFFVLTSS